jgi:hypothetical protein
MKRMFDPKTGDFFDGFEIKISCNNWDLFLSNKMWTVPLLEEQLTIALSEENYEMAELLKKHITLKSTKP